MPRQSDENPTGSQISTLLWHPLVHEHFDETLYYYLLNFTAYDSQTLHAFERFLEEKQSLTGFSLYPVLGSFDVLVRIWLNPVAARRLEANLPSACEIHASIEVSSMSHWAFNVPMEARVKLPRLLGKYTVDQYSDVQTGKDEQLRAQMEAEKLLWCGPTSFKDWIKFYVGVTYPPTRFAEYRSLIRQEIQQAVTEFDSRVKSVSLYETAGGMLIKGCVQDFYTIGDFALLLRSKLTPFRALTETWLLASADSRERDDLSTGSLNRESAFDREINAFCPEFYELGLPARLRTPFENYLRRPDVQIFRFLPETQRDLLSAIFVATARELTGISSTGPTCFDLLSSWFPTQEQLLRDKIDLLVIALADGKARAQKRLWALLGSRRTRKFRSLGDLLSDMEALLGAARDAGKTTHAPSEDDRRALQDAIQLRNEIAHGSFRCDPDWQRPLDVVYKFLVAFLALCGAADTIISEWQVRLRRSDSQGNSQ